MPTYTLYCTGDHDLPMPLGKVTYDVEPHPGILRATRDGLLCEDCGAAVGFLTASGELGPRQKPSRAQVDDALGRQGKGRVKPR